MIRFLAAVGVSASPAPILQLRDDIPVDRALEHTFTSKDDPIIHFPKAQRLTRQSFDAAKDTFIVIRYKYDCFYSQKFLQDWQENLATIEKNHRNTTIYWMETDTERNDDREASGVWRQIVRSQDNKWGVPNIQMVTKKPNGRVRSHRVGTSKFIHRLSVGPAGNLVRSGKNKVRSGKNKVRSGKNKVRSGKNKACSKRKQRKQLLEIKERNQDDPIVQTPGAKHITTGSLKKVKGPFIAVRYLKDCKGFKKLKKSWNAFMEEIKKQGHNWPVYFVQSEEDKRLRAGGLWEFHQTIDENNRVPNVQFVYKPKCKGKAHTMRIRPYGKNLERYKMEQIVKQMNMFSFHSKLTKDDSCNTSAVFPSTKYSSFYRGATPKIFPHFQYVQCNYEKNGQLQIGVVYCDGGKWTEVPDHDWRC